MPTQLTIPVRPQFGVGSFEPVNAFGGLSGLRFAWETTFGQMLPTLDEAFTGLPGAGGLILFPAPPKPDNIFSVAGDQTLANIGKGLTNTQHHAASHYVAQSFLFDGFATAIRNAADSQVHAHKVVQQKTKPRKVIEIIRPTVRVNLRPLQAQVAKANARAAAAEKRNAELQKRIQKLEHAIAEPAPIPWPGLPGEVDRIGRGVGRIWDKLRNPSKLFGIAALLALLAKTLEKMGVNYIRCRNNKRWGSHVCRNGENFLSNLIALTTLAVGTYDLLEFAKMMQGTTGEVSKAARYFWHVK